MQNILAATQQGGFFDGPSWENLAILALIVGGFAAIVFKILFREESFAVAMFIGSCVVVLFFVVSVGMML